MTTPVQSAIFDQKLNEFFAEYEARNGVTGVQPSVAVRFAAPGLEMYFDLEIGANTFDPPFISTGP